MSKPMFQHRHYVAIAQVMADSRPLQVDGDFYHGTRVEWRLRRSMLADMFAADNPNFSRDRFEAACEGKPINGRDK